MQTGHDPTACPADGPDRATQSPNLSPPLQALTQLPSLAHLSLASCNVRDAALETLPELPGLTGLNLTDNAIAGSLAPLARLPNLRDLDLSGNRIAAVSALAPLTALTNLTALDVSACPLEATDPDIRAKLFEMLAVLPALNYINGEDRLGEGECLDAWKLKACMVLCQQQLTHVLGLLSPCPHHVIPPRREAC